MPRIMVTLTCAAVLAAACVMSAQDVSKADATSMQRKLVAIAQRGAKPPAKTPQRSVAPLTTSFSDREANAYFKINGPEFLPPGLENPQVTIEDGGRVRSRATVDLDVVLKTRQRSMFDPLSWLTGKTEITAVGLVRGANNKGTVQLESATLGGIPVPKPLLQQIVNYYTRTPENPQGVDLDQPFDLPSNIRSLETRRGMATIVQP